jgi:hypothetical protein
MAGGRHKLRRETYFADELASGKTDLPGAKCTGLQQTPFVEKYGAYTSSLFINTVRDGADHIEQA